MPAGSKASPRAVVTGAAGFIGSHLTDRLLALGYSVTGLDRRALTDPFAAHNLSAARSHRCFAAVHADLAVADLDPILDGAETVFHLAAVPGVRPSWSTRFADYATSNVIGTQRVLSACERTKVRRLVYASSSSVYGAASAPSRETDPTLPISPYGVTKLAGEHLCLAHAARPDSTLTVAALRYFTVYGPRQRPDMAISRVLAAALSGAAYSVFGDGTQRREFTYVDDVIDATIAAARARASAMVINVGGGSSVPMRHVLELAGEVVGMPVPVRMVAAQAGDVASTAADLERARALLDYKPSTDLRTGMARHAEWLRRLAPELLERFNPPLPAQEAAA